MKPTVIGALRKFLPGFASRPITRLSLLTYARYALGFLATNPPLSRQQRRAIWAIEHCRTPAMGADLYVCPKCGKEHFAYHSCNHRSCPQCGNAARQQWVQRELGKLINAPYFMVTFTLPQELRHCFFSGEQSKLFYDIFFTAASGALKEKLATAKGFKALQSGFTAVLHTWNQQLFFHPHLHFLVPGAGLQRFSLKTSDQSRRGAPVYPRRFGKQAMRIALDANGKVVQVRKPNYLLHLPLLQAAFREHFRKQLKNHDWTVDPAVWRKANWGIHIQAFGAGEAALKYLGKYVARTAIADSRMINVTKDSVTFVWKDRVQGGCQRSQTISGIEFVRRYLRHVLPPGLRSIRYYGFCHPAAARTWKELWTALGKPRFSSVNNAPSPTRAYQCAQCQVAVKPLGRLGALWKLDPNRGPPRKPIKLVRSQTC